MAEMKLEIVCKTCKFGNSIVTCVHPHKERKYYYLVYCPFYIAKEPANVRGIE